MQRTTKAVLERGGGWIGYIRVRLKKDKNGPGFEALIVFFPLKNGII